MEMSIIIGSVILLIMLPLIIKSMNEELRRLNIRPGHYQKNTYNSEGPQRIIRIIGEDQKNPGYWVDMLGKRYSEDELANSYTLLETYQSEDDAKRSSAARKPLIIGDLPTVEERENNGDYDRTQGYEPPTPQPQAQPNQQPQPQPQPQPQQQTQQASIPDTIETQIINKCRSNNKTTINISLSFETDIDINGVIQTCSILNLNKREVAKQLTQILIKDNIQKSIESKITNVIDGKENLETSQVLPKTTYTIDEIKQLLEEQTSKIQETIKESISEINVQQVVQAPSSMPDAEEVRHLVAMNTPLGEDNPPVEQEEKESLDMSDFLSSLDARLEQFENEK